MEEKKKIRIDLAMLKNLNCGMGQVHLAMGKYLAKSELNSYLEFLVPPNFMGYFGDTVSYTSTSLYKRMIANTSKYSLCHTTHQLSPFGVSSKTPKITTVHDLNFLYEKPPSKQKKYFILVKKHLTNARFITYISEFTKSEVNKYFNIPTSTVQKVIYNGVSLNNDKTEIKPSFVKETPFLFTIGEIKEKKNFAVLIDFIKRLPKEISLVIAGNNTTKYAKHIQKTIIKNGLDKRIFLVGKILEEEKRYLYKNCMAFVFPSLFEGFGLPVIEAMQFGKPVFLSTSTSLPEIGGNLAFYWDNFDPDQMYKIFQEKMTLYNSAYKQELMAYSNQFSWEKNLQNYLDIYKQFL